MEQLPALSTVLCAVLLIPTWGAGTNFIGRLNVSDLDLLQKGEATLTLSELEKRDSGLYQCQISIHQGESGTGAGTELQVMGRNQSDTGKEPAPVGCCSRELLYQVAIALGLLLILGLVATLLLKRC
ncbi:unnamed protein product [Caretta caretta]